MSKKGFKPTSLKNVNHHTPVVVYFGTFGVGFTGYIIGRIILNTYPHPLHWLFGVVGAMVGYLVGWIWYRWRGDII